MSVAPSISGIGSQTLEGGQETVLNLFRQVVCDSPDAVAVVHEDRELTFADLQLIAEQFAVELHRRGARQGEYVGLCMERSPEAIAAMLGCFMAGAAFVPLDPEYPLDRIEFMIQDAGIQRIITDSRRENALAAKIGDHLELEWIDCSEFVFASVETPEERLAQLPSPQVGDLAYLMYTSGSTGNPKGVQIEHGALTAYCMADIEVYRLSSEDRTLQFSTLNFDIAIEEIFPPLLIGSCVVVRPRLRANDANELSSIVERYGITAVHLATAYWHEWVDLMRATGDCVPPTLRLVIATGEKVSVEHYRRWLELCQHDVLWCNAYGPTEATVSATVFIPDENFNADNMPIGYPLVGYTARILNEDDRPVGPEETGQLHIGGPALSRGYLNRDELNQKAFRFVEHESGNPERLYATGDLARWLPDGQIEFAGRIDHQIKLGSYRIEPGEIEAALNKHPSVRDSLVCYEQAGTQKYLIAYVATGGEQLHFEHLAEFLAAALPPYMVPARYCLLDTFPLTVNGKVDRGALPEPTESVTVQSGTYISPRSDLEKRLSALWSEVLNIPKVGVYDDFFALGGSSLLVTRVVAELTAQFGIELPVRDFFANPTVASAARHLARMLGEPAEVEDVQVGAERAHRRQCLPQIEGQFIGASDRQLFTVLYRPPAVEQFQQNSRRHGVVICPPLGHEYTRSYRNLQQLALQLASAGFEVLRFDYSGTGNSEGRCEDLRLESLQSDLRRAIDYITSMDGVDGYSLLGLRLGATIAATTKHDCDPAHRVLWDPVIRGASYVGILEDFHQFALRSQTRFVRKMKPSKLPQLFGHSWEQEKRQSIKCLRMPLRSEFAVDPFVVTSRGYVSQEPEALAWCSAPEGEADDALDDIGWHDPEFTERAFASVHASEAIVDFLTQNVASEPLQCGTVPLRVNVPEGNHA
ncbi:MAG: amino acid adenylation domain-containing protein [Pirellulaceae bacterium]